jgi:hypothetical protein
VAAEPLDEAFDHVGGVAFSGVDSAHDEDQLLVFYSHSLFEEGLLFGYLGGYGEEGEFEPAEAEAEVLF